MEEIFFSRHFGTSRACGSLHKLSSRGSARATTAPFLSCRAAGDEGRPEPRAGAPGTVSGPGFHGYHTIGDGTGGCVKGREGENDSSGAEGGEGRRRSAEPLDWTHRCKLCPDRQADRRIDGKLLDDRGHFLIGHLLTV